MIDEKHVQITIYLSLFVQILTSLLSYDGLKYKLEPDEKTSLEATSDVDPIAYDYYLRSKSDTEIEGLNYIQFREYQFDLVDKAVKILRTDHNLLQCYWNLKYYSVILKCYG